MVKSCREILNQPEAIPQLLTVNFQLSTQLQFAVLLTKTDKHRRFYLVFRISALPEKARPGVPTEHRGVIASFETGIPGKRRTETGCSASVTGVTPPRKFRQTCQSGGAMCRSTPSSHPFAAPETGKNRRNRSFEDPEKVPPAGSHRDETGIQYPALSGRPPAEMGKHPRQPRFIHLTGKKNPAENRSGNSRFPESAAVKAPKHIQNHIFQQINGPICKIQRRFQKKRSNGFRRNPEITNRKIPVPDNPKQRAKDQWDHMGMLVAVHGKLPLRRVKPRKRQKLRIKLQVQLPLQFFSFPGEGQQEEVKKRVCEKAIRSDQQRNLLRIRKRFSFHKIQMKGHRNHGMLPPSWQAACRSP